MALIMNSDEMNTTIEDVKSDNSETNWVAYKYEGRSLVFAGQGEDHEDMFRLLKENDDRIFAYFRVETGDEMSKRKKFASLTFIGNSVSPLHKAKMSIDKAYVKDIFGVTAADFLVEPDSELTLKEMTDTIRKAGGANYNAQS